MSFIRRNKIPKASAKGPTLAASLRHRHRPGERAAESLISLNGLLAVIVLIGIFVFLLKEGLPLFSEISVQKFLFGTHWYPVSDPPIHPPLA
jgi:phosphate transport system permease protein